MRGRLLLIVVCLAVMGLGVLVDTRGRSRAGSATIELATRYHAARRTKHFYQHADSGRVLYTGGAAAFGDRRKQAAGVVRPVDPPKAAGHKTSVR